MASERFERALPDVAREFEAPRDLLDDETISDPEKAELLERWQEQLSGRDPNDLRLAEIRTALRSFGGKDRQTRMATRQQGG